MKFTDSRITAALVETVDGIIEGPGGSLTKWKRAIGELDEVSIPYVANSSIWEVMVHTDDRGGLGLNPHNVHSNLKLSKTLRQIRQQSKTPTPCVCCFTATAS